MKYNKQLTPEQNEQAEQVANIFLGEKLPIPIINETGILIPEGKKWIQRDITKIILSEWIYVDPSPIKRMLYEIVDNGIDKPPYIRI